MGDRGDKHNKPNQSRIYISNFPLEISKKDLEDVFTDYGKVTYSNIKRGEGYIVSIINLLIK